MTAEEVASALDQECVRLRKALELERIENLKLQQDATLFDFEMFVVAQERRIRECLSPNTRDDQRENPQ